MTTKRPIEAAGASRRCPQSRRINCPDCGKDVATKSDGSPRGHTCPHGKSCPQLRGFACESCPVGVTTKRHLESLHGVLGEILDGLAGRPFAWGSGERLSKSGLLYELGVELVTETAAKKLGHRLRRRAAPVGSVYFNAPISKSRPVYVLHVQTSPVERQAREGSQAGANKGASFTTSRPGLVPVQREVPVGLEAGEPRRATRPRAARRGSGPLSRSPAGAAEAP